MQKFLVLRDTVRRALLQNEFYLALEAMEFGERHHVGRRLNGDHEFSHQLRIAMQVLAAPMIDDIRDTTLAVAFLHDVSEDHDVRDDTLRVRFSDMTADCVSLLTKPERRTAGDCPNDYMKCAKEAVAAIVKGYDRLDNLRTMDGAFSAAKQLEYRAETSDRILPMLHSATRRHPSRAAVLQHIQARLEPLVANDLAAAM